VLYSGGEDSLGRNFTFGIADQRPRSRYPDGGGGNKRGAIGGTQSEGESRGNLRRRRYSQRSTPTFFERFEQAFLNEAEVFVASLSAGPATGLTLDDAREATRIGIAMRESLAKGQAVNL